MTNPSRHPKKKRVYMVGAELSKLEYDKIQRVAKSEDRSVSAVIRRFIAQLPDLQSEDA